MKFQNTVLVLLVATSLRSWVNEVIVLADQVPSNGEAQVAAQQAGVGSELPGLPVRTSKGEEDMKHPDMLYGHDKELGKYAPLSPSGQPTIQYISPKNQVSVKYKTIFLRCCGC